MVAREYFLSASKAADLLRDAESRLQAMEAGLPCEPSDGQGGGTAFDPSWRIPLQQAAYDKLRATYQARIASWRLITEQASEVAYSIETGNPVRDSMWTRVLLLGYIDGLKPSEIAECLGCSVQAVYTADSRALAWVDDQKLVDSVTLSF